ncbi:DNA repair protein RecN [Aliikangiella sp. G2MR2-5]|uniref:DNA repair protein RecN n=1 Tax=Aliikangiella sp. G2MR2-5 TaxID=2788943 RepID=UPI0018AC5A7D|nr:DNA repair protein RecN [Aliikangiella sp. G2MR2-5]
MLSRIEVRNFAIIQSLALDWSNGMTVITGETGAGKSIVIDALGLALGERADASSVYPGASQAEVVASFELQEQSAAAKWLSENELEEEGECILRRVIAKEGRSKCFINGRSATLSQLKTIGSLLVDIHGQHAHQSLLKNREQLNLLDRFAGHANLLENVKEKAMLIKQIEKRKLLLEEQKLARDAKRDLLVYQVEELEEANPQQAVLDSLEQEHKKAATSQDRLQLAEESRLWLDGEANEACLPSLARTIEKVSQLKSLDPKVENLLEILIQSEGLLQEARDELSHYIDRLEVDPETLLHLDQQLGQFHDLARKHHVSLAQLPQHFVFLKEELAQLEADDSELEAIETEHKAAIESYRETAAKLSNSRKKIAKSLQDEVSESLQILAMDGGRFEIQLSPIDDSFPATGLESIEFLVSANPGQPLQALGKVASGGELSRISLAIAVITAKQQLVPTLIFDEVDVGIGGGTAEVVGRLLEQLSADRQVICVTHQPQVASCGRNHLIASKTKMANSTTTQMKNLNSEERVQEIGRMLGGLNISEKTLTHAREMLGV